MPSKGQMSLEIKYFFRGLENKSWIVKKKRKVFPEEKTTVINNCLCGCAQMAALSRFCHWCHWGDLFRFWSTPVWCTLTYHSLRSEWPHSTLVFVSRLTPVGRRWLGAAPDSSGFFQTSVEQKSGQDILRSLGSCRRERLMPQMCYKVLLKRTKSPFTHFPPWGNTLIRGLIHELRGLWCFWRLWPPPERCDPGAQGDKTNINLLDPPPAHHKPQS